jgi:CelD/BcsL family acetyltransferase involved in cellulose biosynthesis
MDLHQNAASAPVRKVKTGRKAVYRVQPLEDSRWVELVERHPLSSVFHTVAWLEALHRTYGYEPITYTTSSPRDHLENGLVFCGVASWLNGRRMVSLPFSDHCEPLVDSAEEEELLLAAAEQEIRPEKLRYLEVRPVRPFSDMIRSWHAEDCYVFHELDLRPDLNTLFAKFHKSSTQRKIRRAQREGLNYETGRSRALLEIFWDLLLITRRRHCVPPQPKSWFRNLIDVFGDALQIRVAFKDNHPAAAIMTLRHKDTLTYKYGCSDAAFHNLGGMHLLFWRSMEEAKREGLCTFDLGRTDPGNSGLITFKDRWGSARSALTYSRFSAHPTAQESRSSGMGWIRRIAKSVVPCLPDRLLRMAGDLLYRHIA